MKIKIKDYIALEKNKNILKLQSGYGLKPDDNALFKAIFSNDLELIKLLSKCGISFSSKINNTYPLHFAAFRGDIEIFKFISSHLNEIDSKSLSTSILNQNKEINEYIFDKITKNRIQIDLSKYIDDHFTLLTLSILVGDIDSIEKLVNLGADINQKELKRGDSPLALATMSNDIEIVKLLLKHDVDTNLVGNDGFSPLIIASYQGNIEIVKLLLEYNANIDYETHEGFTAFEIALSNNKTNVSNYLSLHKSNLS